MPANHKVSIGWQIVFTFLPLVNFWAFHRIKKLRKYILYIVVPSLALSIIILASYRPPQTPWGEGEDGFGLDQPPATRESGDYIINRVEIWRPYGPAFVVGQVIGWALQGFSIYLVIIWSRRHNQGFDVPPTQGQL